jgi:hypothetical protein
MGASTDSADPVDQIAAIAEGYANPQLEWYLNGKRLPRMLFRAAGVVIIVLSVSIPFLTTVTFWGRDVVLSLAALLIAALTGLSSFYNWDQAWRGRQQTAEALQHLIASWRILLTNARAEPDPIQRRALVTSAARKLIDGVKAVTGAEAEQFFSEVKLPQGVAK